MTVESISDEDGCNGNCCTGPGRRTVRPANAHRIKPLTPFPARTRLRLAAHRRIDGAGAWLCGHHGTRAAGVLWRTCRMI